MRWKPQWRRAALALAIAASFCGYASAEEPVDDVVFPLDDVFETQDYSRVSVVTPEYSFARPVAYNTFLPEALQRPELGSESPLSSGNRIVSDEEEVVAAEEERSLIEPPNQEQTESLPSKRIEDLGAGNAGSALQDSPEIQTLNVQRRSTVAFDPRVRGYHIGQVTTQAEGIYWLPVRPDLDSMLGRYDARSIDNLNVIAGPYAVRYGPGFAFIDMDLANTPRYECCESHNRLGYVYRANGQQHYVVDTYWGGSTDYGYIVNYAYRNGADYKAGDGSRIPSSYLVNNVSGQLGWDLGLDSNIEFRYDFVDQRNTQIPGQFFDLDELETHSFLATYVNRDDSASWTQLRVDAWYNRTPARGSLRNEPYFRVQERVESALDTRFGQPQGTMSFTGDTDSRLQAAGGRAELEYGDPDDVQLFVGTDVRHLRQFINERFAINGPPGLNFGVATELPDSEMFNPGAYAQLDVPLSSYWMTHWGARGDYVHTIAPGQATHDNGMYAFFLRNDIQLTDTAVGTVAFGHAQRAPTLIERYSRGIFVSVIQNGFTRVLGDDTLGTERLWQIDAALNLDYGDTRANIAGYHSWIQDYVTYTGALVDDPTGARLLQYTSTDLATLTGFEARAERDLSSRWTAFVAGHYVYGMDRTLNAPLWGMSPLEGQVGLNWHDDSPQDRYAVEGVVRFVDSQHRLGAIAPNVPPGNSFPDERLIPIEDVTPCFTVVNIRGYWNLRNDEYQQLRLIGGVENLFDATYLQHLDLRLSQPTAFGTAFAYAPGITPFVGIDWTY